MYRETFESLGHASATMGNIYRSQSVPRIRREREKTARRDCKSHMCLD